ncbi:unnamed protein product, partial [Ilex paraguariensis]
APSLTPDELMRVSQVARAEAVPYTLLVTPKNLLWFGTGSSFVALMEAMSRPLSLVIDVDSSLGLPKSDTTRLTDTNRYELSGFE